MSHKIEALIARLRMYCGQKPGSSETFTFGEERPTYRILYGFLDAFASFYLTEEPVQLELRCDNDLLNDVQELYAPHITISERKKWNTIGWEWISIPLPGPVTEVDLHRLIDASYDIVFRKLNEDSRRLFSLIVSRVDIQSAILTLIIEHDLSLRREEILALIRPAILLHTQKSDMSKLRPAQSRIGGVPDLPADWEWPTFHGNPLAFLAQINLAEIPLEVERGDLPRDGILYFFSVYGWQKDDGDIHPDLDWNRAEEIGFSQALWFIGDTTSLRRASKPDGIRTFDAAAVEYLPVISLPRAEPNAREPVVAALQWSEDEYERLDNLYFDLDYYAKTVRGFSVDHQLLGYAGAIQTTVTPVNHRLLFQLDSDYNQTGMEWGDGGMIYFVIEQEALKRGDFSKIVSDFQCG